MNYYLETITNEQKQMLYTVRIAAVIHLGLTLWCNAACNLGVSLIGICQRRVPKD